MPVAAGGFAVSKSGDLQVLQAQSRLGRVGESRRAETWYPQLAAPCPGDISIWGATSV